jgi:hypothetical protein
MQMIRLKKKIISYLSLGTLIAGTVLGGYALARIWLVRASLPAGTCPVISYRPLLYAGIALCLVSFVLSLLEHHSKKAEAQNKQ